MTMYKIMHVLVMTFALLGCRTTHEPLKLERALAENRTRFEQDRKQEILRDVKLPWTPENAGRWQGILWGAELLQFRHDSLLIGMKQGMEQVDALDPEWQRALLEAVYTLYPAEFRVELREYALRTTSPKLFAMTINYLVRVDGDSGNSAFPGLLEARFPDWKTDPILFMLGSELSGDPDPQPPLAQLLAHDFWPGVPVVFSLQRPDRRHPGLVIMRDAESNFLCDEQDVLIGIPQLALAVSNLPGYLTNGNTPQGFMTLKGTDVSENMFIGPTANLQLRLPYEVDADDFFAFTGITGSAWSLDMYRRLLPPEWQDYLPIYESYYAGRAGRTEIIAHGTTINPEYYRGRPYYPYTPSLGCLTTLELWSSEDGHRTYSDQERLIKACERLGREDGLYMVVELEDVPAPVTIKDVIRDVLEAQRIIRQNGDH